MPRPVAVIPVGDDTQEKAMEIAYKLRLAGFSVEQSYSGNMKKRLIKANKVNAYKAVIIGSEEAAAGTVTLKDLDEGSQKTVSMTDLIKELS
jgi:histidyl-tRNA synthetase